MSPLLQWLIVSVLVAGATMFAASRLLTPRLRLRGLSALLHCLPKGSATGPVARWRAAVASRSAADAAGGSACAACSKH